MIPAAWVGFACACALVSGVSRAAPPGIELACEIDGQTLALAGVDGGRLMVGSGNALRAVPDDATWTMTGDLAENAQCVFPMVPCAVYRLSPPDARLDPARAWGVKLMRGSIRDARGRSGEEFLKNHVRAIWRDAPRPDSVYVFGWWWEGRLTHVAAVPAAALFGEDSAWSKPLFTLSAAEFNGVAVQLHWTNGGLQPMDGADANVRDFLRAILMDDGSALAGLLESPAGKKLRPKMRAMAAALAAWTNSQACLVLLLDEPTNLALTRKFGIGGQSIFQIAAAYGRPSIIDRFYDQRIGGVPANPAVLFGSPSLPGHQPGSVSRSAPLRLASMFGHTEAVRTMLRKLPASGAKPNLSAAINDAIDKGFADIAEDLWQASAPVSFGSKTDGERLIRQAAQGHTAMVRWLLARGAYVGQDASGRTPLHAAARGGEARLAEILLDAGADPDRRDADGVTPIFRATAAGNEAFARVLLDHGVDPNRAGAKGRTVMHLAALCNMPALVTALLDHGAERDARDAQGFTALDIALLAGSRDAAEALMIRKARLRSDAPQFPLIVRAAVAQDFDPLIAELLSAGWRPESLPDDDWPVWTIARAAGADRCEALRREATGSDAASPPFRICQTAQLDSGLRPRNDVSPEDPRGPNEEFPEQRVTVDVVLDSEGVPRCIRAGPAADLRLIPAAVQNVRDHRFLPPTSGGQPTAVRATLTVTFPSSAQRAFEIFQVDRPPRIVRRIEPKRLAGARFANVDADVSAILVVDRHGQARDIQIVKSPAPEYAENVLAALRRWTFEPGMLEFSHVDVRVAQKFTFGKRKSRE